MGFSHDNDNNINKKLLPTESDNNSKQNILDSELSIGLLENFNTINEKIINNINNNIYLLKF